MDGLTMTLGVIGAAGGGVNYGAKEFLDRPAADITEGFTLSSQDRVRVKECLDASPSGSTLDLSRATDGTIICVYSAKLP